MGGGVGCGHSINASGKIVVPTAAATETGSQKRELRECKQRLRV